MSPQSLPKGVSVCMCECGWGGAGGQPCQPTIWCRAEACNGEVCRMLWEDLQSGKASERRQPWTETWRRRRNWPVGGSKGRRTNPAWLRKGLDGLCSFYRFALMTCYCQALFWEVTNERLDPHPHKSFCSNVGTGCPTAPAPSRGTNWSQREEEPCLPCSISTCPAPRARPQWNLGSRQRQGKNKEQPG